MRRCHVGVMVGVLAMAMGLGIVVAAAATGPVAVRLGAGKVSVFQWRVSAFRDDGPRGALRPCIRISLQGGDYSSGGGTSETCGPVQPQANAQAMVNEIANPTVAVLAMAFKPSVARVRLFLAGHKSRFYSLLGLPVQKAAKAKLAPFVYLTRGFVGHFCLERFVTYSDNGRVLDPGERMGCHGRR